MGVETYPGEQKWKITSFTYEKNKKTKQKATKTPGKSCDVAIRDSVRASYAITKSFRST